MANEYATVAELKTWLGISGSSQDANLAIVIEAASRAIDDWCGRRFYDDGSATARIYTPEDPYVLEVDDISTATGLVVKTDQGHDGTYETTWTRDQYTGNGFRLEPVNASAQSAPWHRIRVLSLGAYFPCRNGSVQVTANWGWPAEPPAVKQATLLHAQSIWISSGMLQSTGGTPGVLSVSLEGSDSVTYADTGNIVQAFAADAGPSDLVKSLLDRYRKPLI